MLHAAILGFGTVGSGVAEVIRMNNASIAAKLGDDIQVKYILDIRDFSNSPYADKVIKDFAIIENETGLPIFCGVVSELK